MTGLTPRLRWSRALAEAVVPASLRPMKATLLALARIVAPTGELHAWRDEMTATAGVPERTLTRHLQHAVDSWWLVRVVPGGHGRRSLYRAVIPESCGPRMARNSGSCGPSARTQLPEVVGHPAAHSIKKSASASERVAVDHQRGRRTAHDEDRAEREHDVTSQAGTNMEWLPTPVADASYDSTGART